MDRTLLLLKLKALHETGYGSNDVGLILKEMESLVEKYLKENPCDAGMFIRLALIVDTVPLADYVKAIECLKRAIECDPNNAIAILILTYITAHSIWIDEDIFQQLSAVQSDDKEIMSMVEFAKSWYYQDRSDYYNYEKVLIKSIELCNEHVRNYKFLGLFYLQQGKKYEGRQLLQKALNNVRHVYSGNEHYKIYDANEFLNQKLKGIHLSKQNFESLQESFRACKNQF